MSDVISSMTDMVNQTRLLLDEVKKQKGGIDAAVQTAISTVPEHVRIVWLDQAHGDDKNDGLTSAKPIKTIGHALHLGGAGRTVYIRLLSDYTFLWRRESLLENQTVHIHGWDTAVKRKIILPVLPIGETSIDFTSSQCEMAGFYQGVLGHNIVVLNNVELVFPSAPPATSGTLASVTYSAFVGGNGTIGGSMLTFEMYGSEITYPADGVGVLIGSGTRPISLVVKSSTYPAHFAGHWIGFVAAGTPVPVAGKSWLQASLPTL